MAARATLTLKSYQPGLLWTFRRHVRNKSSVVRETVHLAAGTEFPAVTQDLLRFYSMRFCPFAHRTKLVLAHKCIPHEVVNINLQSKPEWFLRLNPLGTTPALQLNDTVVYDSLICNEWLDNVYAQKKLFPDDPFENAKWKMFAERFGKVIGGYYKVLNATSHESKHHGVRDLHLGLSICEEALTSPFFGGAQVMVVDFHVWPWFERLPLLSRKGFDFARRQYPRLHGWVELMKQQRGVASASLELRLYEAYMDSTSRGHPDYDISVPPTAA